MPIENGSALVVMDLPISDKDAPEKSVSRKPQTTQKVPNWLPDWRQPDGYPDPKTEVSREQWAWEFMRRNSRYQKLYREGRRHKESWYKKFPNSEKFSRYFQCVPKATKSESYSEYMARCHLDGTSPKVTPKREKILDFFPVMEFSAKLNPNRKTPPIFNKHYFYPICETVSEDDAKITFLIGGKHEVFMVFSAAFPIKDQIERAESYLLEQQRDYEEQGNELHQNGRVRIQPLRNYLRYLDGKASGATQVEIARCVHPNEDETSAKQKVSKGLNRAEFYRDAGYLEILDTEI